MYVIFFQFLLGSSYSCAISIYRCWDHGERKHKWEVSTISNLINKATQRALPEKQPKTPDIETGLRVLLWHSIFKNINKLTWISWMASWKSQMLLLLPVYFSHVLDCVLGRMNQLYITVGVKDTSLFRMSLFYLIYNCVAKGWRVKA